MIELDDSAEEDLLKSNGHSEAESKSLTDDYIELDKKEEDKLLQIDSDLVESSDDRIVADDLKIENKLLELDNENSNHSVTSVKSDHSVQSVKSVKQVGSRLKAIIVFIVLSHKQVGSQLKVMIALIQKQAFIVLSHQLIKV